MNRDDFIASNTVVENVVIDHENILKVVKSRRLMDFDINSYSKLKQCDFHNGVIEVKMLSKLLKDAPDFARGFIGIAFRIQENDQQFESFYIRPTNGRNCEDPIRKSHGCQYFSFPKYTFAYFREMGITEFENSVDVDLEEWISLKAVIQGTSGEFFINDKMVLSVDSMKMGDCSGSVGLFVDIGTEAYFKDLKIRYD